MGRMACWRPAAGSVCWSEAAVSLEKFSNNRYGTDPYIVGNELDRDDGGDE